MSEVEDERPYEEGEPESEVEAEAETEDTEKPSEPGGL